MYSILSTLFVIGVFLIVAGFLGRVGTDGISDVGENVAAALGLLITYAFLILSLGSFSELATFFEGICGGIPFLNEIADYIYKLTSIDNKFYSEHKVLVEENKDLQESWLVLTNIIYKVNMLLLDVLGIKVPSKM